MNANGRRVRQANNGYRHIAKLCGKSLKGGRSIYKATAGLTVAQSIERERRVAARQAAMKGKKKKGK